MLESKVCELVLNKPPALKLPLNSAVGVIDSPASPRKYTKILFVPLAWNFYDEIKTRILKVRKNKNDRFLKYFPEIKEEKWE